MTEPHIAKPVPREPTDKMLDQGLVYLPNADRDALKAAWRVMYDVAPYQAPNWAPLPAVGTGLNADRRLP
jgi:hypothetical protein